VNPSHSFSLSLSLLTLIQYSLSLSEHLEIIVIIIISLHPPPFPSLSFIPSSNRLIFKSSIIVHRKKLNKAPTKTSVNRPHLCTLISSQLINPKSLFVFFPLSLFLSFPPYALFPTPLSLSLSLSLSFSLLCRQISQKNSKAH
jgi:hypothetical protein